MTRRRWLVLLVVAMVAAGAGLYWWHESTDREYGGPLEASGKYRSHTQMAPPGSVVSEGFQILFTSEPITIESVDVNGGDEALEFLGARIGLPGRRNDFHQWMSGYPPKAVRASLQVPAEGAVLEPGDGYMLIIGYRVRPHVLDLRTSLTVSYKTEDGDLYERDFPAQVLTCPPDLTEHECGAVAEERWPF